MKAISTRDQAVATRNACRMCAPLGAAWAFRGIEGAVPFLHGSQGCATYIRRYMISHFREPLDVASSSFTEEAAVFGGAKILRAGLENVAKQYQPSLIGVASTCLSETIGEDLAGMVRLLKRDEQFPPLVYVSTPSYSGSHATGFHAAVAALAEQLANNERRGDWLNIFPGMVSPADLRYLKELLKASGVNAILVPDYSETLDGASWSEYQRVPPGGTPVDHLRRLGGAQASIQFGGSTQIETSAATFLQNRFGVPAIRLEWPVGISATKRFLKALRKCGGHTPIEPHNGEWGRLVDAYVDGHKYLFDRRVALFGDSDLVVGLAGFLAEVGLRLVLCATGEKGTNLKSRLAAVAPEQTSSMRCLEGVDFEDIREEVKQCEPEILMGSSKGYKLARPLKLPLLRVGFPIHDRFGGQRIQHLGYRGAQQLLDRLINTVIEREQAKSTVGYSYY